MQESRYYIKNESFSGQCTFAVISDLHGCEVTEAIAILEHAKPDVILAAGDILERLDGTRDDKNENGYLLLREAAGIAPTFYSFGNHELGGTRSWLPRRKIPKRELVISEADRARLISTGVTILNDEYTDFEGIAIGGLMSGALNEDGAPCIEWLNAFCGEDKPKVLISHHPEYYKKYLAQLDIDLVVSGHAHGGQWRFFGRGVFAPGQGIFPKYTSGVYENRLVVSRGMKTDGTIPRIFNPTEAVIIKING